MTKDYAKRSASKQKNVGAAKKVTPAKILLLVIIALIIAAFIFWLRGGISASSVGHKQPVVEKQSLPPVESITASSLHAQKNLSQPVSKAASSASSAYSATDSDSQSSSSMDYQFYTLLSEIKVIDPNQDGQNLPGAAPGFWLQMAVYYTEKDANAMVERLQLLGMNPDVIQRLSESSNKMLYYVAQGPYETRALALQKQKDLQKLKLDSMIYEVKAPSPG